MSYGEAESAWKEMENLLRTELKEREMLNHFKMSQCDLPTTAVEIIQARALLRPDILESNDVKYVLLLLHMSRQDICGGKVISLNPDFYAIMDRVAIADANQKRQKGLNLLQTSVESLCADSALQKYLLEKKYVIHPCKDFGSIVSFSKSCEAFVADLPPAYEELQATSFAKAFIGSANALDIIHHVFAADAQQIFTEGKKLNVLFAEYFSTKMVMSLIGAIERLQFKYYEVTVVAASERKLFEVKEMIAGCSSVAGLRPNIKVTYVNESLETYLDSRANMHHRFDFIEYNGGMSFSPNYSFHLSKLKGVLTEKGVIGVTYFTDNRHVRQVRELIRQRNVSAHVPFSVDPLNIIKSYLEMNDLSFLSEDQDIITVMGGEPLQRAIPPQKEEHLYFPAHTAKLFSKSSADLALAQAGLKVISRLPSAYSSPYEEIESYEVKKFKSYGYHTYIIHNICTSFNYLS